MKYLYSKTLTAGLIALVVAACGKEAAQSAQAKGVEAKPVEPSSASNLQPVATTVESKVQAVSSEGDLLSGTYQQCISKADGVDPLMLECIASERKVQDAKLNQTYQAISSGLNAAAKAQLVKAQRAWLVSTRADYDFDMASLEGTAGRLTAEEGELMRLAQRVHYLEDTKTQLEFR